MSYRKDKPAKQHSSARLTMHEIESFPIAEGIPERGISKGVCKFFEVKAEFSEVEGRIIAYLFPVTKKGKLTGYIRRDMHAPKDNAFSVVGNVNTECDLLGQHKTKRARKLFITEGLFDYLSLFQAMYSSDFNRKRKERGEKPLLPSVVSIGLGTANAASHITSNLEFIDRFDEVVTVFDNDQATEKQRREGIVKGQDAVQEVSLIIPHLQNVLLELNDPNEYLTSDEYDADDLRNTVLFTARPYEPDNIVSGGIGLDELLVPLKRGVYVDCLPHTSKLLHGFREAEFTVVLAPTHVGKTTICKEIGYSLVKAKYPVGHIFLEEDLKKTQQSYIALDNNVFLPKFREDPSIIDREDAEDSYNRLIDNGRTMWVRHWGSLNSGGLMQKFMWMHMKGMEFIILDHISMVFSGQKTNNERKEIDELLTEIGAFVVATGVHVIVVSHIKRVNKILKRDKEGNIVYPYWEEVDEQMARGSGSFEQIASNIVALEPERLESKERGRIRTRILKNREWSWLGIGDILDMNPTTGRLRVLEDY